MAMTEQETEQQVHINWDTLGFGIVPTKTMFMAEHTDATGWNAGQYLPYGNISLSPAAGVLNYGQGVFEGMKAKRTKKNTIVLFRPFENIKRFSHGASRIAMPEYPSERLLDNITEIVKRNAAYIPPYMKGGLYLRPCLWGTGAILGVGPAPSTTFLLYSSPVGRYFKERMKPIDILVTASHRAAPFGTGNVKTIGNYAGNMIDTAQAKAQGYSGCLYLDAREDRYIEEVGVANFFCVKGNQLLTPQLGSILPGIVRDSIIRIARDIFKMEVIETKVDLQDALQADECFCTGTAAVVAPIGMIAYKEKKTIFNDGQVGPITKKLYDLLLAIQLQEHDDVFNWVTEVKI